MVHEKFVAVCVLGWVMAGCAMQTEGAEGDLSDLKPEDGSELAGNEFGSAQQAHALHFTDGTNLWQETAYPMGTDNPNCKDWWVYDRYINTRPAIGTTMYSTYDTAHPYAQGATIDAWMKTIPETLGYSSAWKQILVYRNSVVARTSGKCSGRYVFQWDNKSGGTYGANTYWASANIPSNLIPYNKPACDARTAVAVPSTLVDLYVCEATRSSDVTSISSWCSRTSGHWRKVGSAQGFGWWNGSSQRCSAGAGVYYQPPANKVAVSFNMVIKAGIGHGVAPADIYILRYD